MASPSKSHLTRLRLAAELRAAGLTWENIAKAVRRRVETCRQWPIRYRAAWQRCFLAGLRKRELEVGCEARETLRSYLRDKDTKTALAAARSLLPKLPPRRKSKRSATETDPELTAFLSCLLKCDHEELERQVRRTLGPAIEANAGDGPPSAA